MRVHISIYGTKQEIDAFIPFVKLYSDDLVQDKTSRDSNVLRSGQWQPLKHWYLSTRHYNTQLIETIRAFCYLHPHTAYLITNIDEILLESNAKGQTDIYNMAHVGQTLTMQEVLLRMRRAVTCLDSALGSLRKGDVTLAIAHDTLCILHSAYVEYMYHDLQSCLVYVNEHARYQQEIFKKDTQDGKAMPELMAVQAVLAMCNESLER